MAWLSVEGEDRAEEKGGEYTNFRCDCLFLQILAGSDRGSRQPALQWVHAQSQGNRDMTAAHRHALVELVARHAGQEGINRTAIPGVRCHRETAAGRSMPAVYAPSLCVIAQGSKQTLLGREIFRYGPAEYLVVSVDLPAIGTVTEASKERPYLCLLIDIDLQQLSELVISTQRTSSEAARGLFVGRLDEKMAESILRLARLLDTPDDIPVLAPLMLREIYYRMLRSDHGEAIAQIVLKGSNLQRIAAIIQRIRADLSQTVSVKELADLAGMSLSSYHVHFKSVTAMSPLQFQKRLRLVEARKIMLSVGADAAHAAYRVGYESPSRFSREYARMFGNPPARDISLIRQQGPEPSAVAGMQ